MKHMLLSLFALTFSAAAFAQGQAVEIFGDSNNMLDRGFISTKTILKFSDEKDFIDLINYNTSPPETIFRVTVSEIDHISFIEDWSEVKPILSGETPLWKTKLTDGGEYIEIEPAGEATPPLPASVRIYDLTGRMVAGRNNWNGERIRTGMLPSGKYILIIDNLNLTFFKK